VWVRRTKGPSPRLLDQVDLDLNPGGVTSLPSQPMTAKPPVAFPLSENDQGDATRS
jgi:hypothetical protein